MRSDQEESTSPGPPGVPNPPGSPGRHRHRRGSGSVLWGLIFVLIGVYFLLRDTFQLTVPDLGRFWPVIVIALGGWIVWQALERDR